MLRRKEKQTSCRRPLTKFLKTCKSILYVVYGHGHMEPKHKAVHDNGAHTVGREGGYFGGGREEIGEGYERRFNDICNVFSLLLVFVM